LAADFTLLRLLQPTASSLFDLLLFTQKNETERRPLDAPSSFRKDLVEKGYLFARLYLLHAT